MKIRKMKTAILSVVITLAVIGGVVALCMYNAVIGISVMVIICLTLLIFPIYKSKKLNTVEKYIASKNSTIRPLMQQIHELILLTVPNVTPVIYQPLLFPAYLLMRGNQFYPIISQQAIIGNKSICIYPHSPRIFEVFSDRIQKYMNNGSSEIFLPVDKPLELDLIRDILLFKMREWEQ